MTLKPGSKLLHYELVEKIGEGGMGVVWKAEDTTLDRHVAIKVLPDALGQHPERLDRFEREAKVLASLHHPNIAVLHGLHGAEGVRFLVMELVDGEDLASRLARGPLPTLDALKLCAQVARALQAAHDRGVIHRDLKPANIVVNASHEAKVLDFGLAKVLDPESTETADESSAPTVTTGGTMVGTILGTAAYMSPEQARGKPTDRRSDIWSFGCVLHECLTGVAEFRGETMSDSIGAILHKSPDWSALPTDLPPTVRWLLHRCLTKDRDNRLHDIADARIELEQAIVDPGASALDLPPRDAEKRPAPRWMWLAMAAVAVVTGLIGWFLKPAAPADLTPVGLSLALRSPMDSVEFTLSPDGKTVVYRAEDPVAGNGEGGTFRLWARRLDAFVPTAIPGTENGGRPAFSADGRSVAFIVANREGGGLHQADLRVVELDGRPPLTVATDATDHSPPVWKDEETILYVTYRNEQELMAVPRGGGDAASFAELPRSTRFTAFDFDSIRGGRWIAVDTLENGTPTIVLIDPQTGVEHDLILGASRSAFLPDGRVLFVRSTALLVADVDFAASPPTLRGEVRTIMSGGSDPEEEISGLVVSTSGHLAFVTGQVREQARSLVTVDREGRTEPLLEGTASYAVPVRFSPDGKRLAVMMWSGDFPRLWIVELDTGARRPMAAEEPFTFHGQWLDDERIVFTSWRSLTGARILTRGIGRNSRPEVLFDDWPDGFRLNGEAISFDGTNLAFDVVRSNGENADIWIRPIDESSAARPLVATPANEVFPAVSPDGRWLAYQSDESGRNEVYLRAHAPDGELSERVVRVSRSGGGSPIWSADSRELFFFENERTRMLSATLGGRAVPEVDEPRVVIEDTEALRAAQLYIAAPLIPMPDGERFVFVQKPAEESKIERIEIVLNWAEQLER